jgi:hypothetical protein
VHNRKCHSYSSLAAGAVCSQTPDNVLLLHLLLLVLLLRHCQLPTPS